jgi:hypothetical protein
MVSREPPHRQAAPLGPPPSLPIDTAGLAARDDLVAHRSGGLLVNPCSLAYLVTATSTSADTLRRQ